MHKNSHHTRHFVAAQHNKINTQTTWFIGCAPLSSKDISVHAYTKLQLQFQFATHDFKEIIT